MLSWKIIKLALLSSKTEIIAMVIGSGLLILVYNLYFDVGVVIYPAILTFAVIVGYLVIKALKLARFYKQLEEAHLGMPEEVNVGDVVEADVFETIKKIHAQHLDQRYQLMDKLETRNALFSQLVHGMKTSVAVVQLACEKSGEKESSAEFADILAENEKLKTSLEQALNLLRLDAFVNDYRPERVELADVVTQMINEHKRDFVYSGVYPKLVGTGVVYTDYKWCGFIISQLISNAIKYTDQDGHLTFEIEKGDDETRLCVTDNGIGIPTEDLPRVFDLFFTGVNGRTRKSSTGIGLFMVKHIADSLGINVAISSEVGVGTTVILEFKHTIKKWSTNL